MALTVGVVVDPPPVTPGPVHEITPPLEVPVKTVEVLEQVIDWVEPAVTVGEGLTVILTASVEVHPEDVVVTVYTVTAGEAPVLVNVNEGLETVVLLKPVDGDHE